MKKYVNTCLTIITICLIICSLVTYINRMDENHDFSTSSKGYTTIGSIDALALKLIGACNAQVGNVTVTNGGEIEFDEAGKIVSFTLDISVYKDYRYFNYQVKLAGDSYNFHFQGKSFISSGKYKLIECLRAIKPLNVTEATKINIDSTQYYNPTINEGYILKGSSYASTNGKQSGIYAMFYNTVTLKQYYFEIDV